MLHETEQCVGASATVHHSTGYTSLYVALLDSESTGAGV